MELLAQLVKDEKVVGYLRIDNKIWWRTNLTWVEIDPQEGCSEFFEDDNGWDAVRPFVCKDKDGNNVFAYNFVWFYWMGKTIKAQVIKGDFFTRLVSCEGEVRGLPRTLCRPDILHIELIKEK